LVRQTMAGGAGDDGFLPRFQMAVYPDQKHNFRFVDRWPDNEARKAVNEVFERLAALTPESVGATKREFDALPWLGFTDDAAAVFADWLTDTMNIARAGEIHESLCAWLGKAAKTCASLALILHLVNGGTGAIPKACMNTAVAWIEYLFSHTKRIYASATQGEALAARALAEKLKARKLENGFCARDVYRPGWTGLDSHNTQSALDMLLELGWLSVREEPTTGRPKLVHEINPKIFAKHAKHELTELTQARFTGKHPPSVSSGSSVSAVFPEIVEVEL